jgi:hypothetical protein
MVEIEKTELYKKTREVLSNYWNENKDDLQYEFCVHLIQYACGKYYDYKRVNTLKAHTVQALESYRKTNKTSSKAFQFQRLLFGYRINLSPAKTNLSSKEANLKKNKNVVKDHIIGTSLIGFYVVYEFKKVLSETQNISGDPFEELAKDKYSKTWFEILSETAEDFSKNWLEKHLCIWSQCRITDTEHSKENLIRGWGEVKVDELTDEKKLEIIFDRLNLSHYNKTKPGGEIPIENYKRKRV